MTTLAGLPRTRCSCTGRRLAPLTAVLAILCALWPRRRRRRFRLSLVLALSRIVDVVLTLTTSASGCTTKVSTGRSCRGTELGSDDLLLHRALGSPSRSRSCTCSHTGPTSTRTVAHGTRRRRTVLMGASSIVGVVGLGHSGAESEVGRSISPCGGRHRRAAVRSAACPPSPRAVTQTKGRIMAELSDKAQEFAGRAQEVTGDLTGDDHLRRGDRGPGRGRGEAKGRRGDAGRQREGFRRRRFGAGKAEGVRARRARDGIGPTGRHRTGRRRCGPAALLVRRRVRTSHRARAQPCGRHEGRHRRAEGGHRQVTPGPHHHGGAARVLRLTPA